MEKKNSDNYFDVTMGSQGGAEACEMIGTLVISIIANVLPKGNSGLYTDDGLIMQRNENEQVTNRIGKKVIKIFKEIGFKMEINTNLKIVDFLDITFNLSNGTQKR